jgi:nitroimidazol reductase NimA-like FMN-containing flavoprotein (pyridoxamine 5'-phosphate oxidase superfamily)
MAQRDLEILSTDECYELLAGSRVGRLVYQDELGPLAVPINYAMSGHNIVFRVGGGAKQAAVEQPILAFEVDEVDADDHSGWSVVARGPAAELQLEQVPALLRELHGQFPTPWAAGVHNVWVEIVPESVTGRRLGRPRTSTTF